MYWYLSVADALVDDAGSGGSAALVRDGELGGCRFPGGDPVGADLSRALDIGVAAGEYEGDQDGNDQATAHRDECSVAARGTGCDDCQPGGEDQAT